MPDSRDDHGRRRHRSPSGSPAPDRDRRQRRRDDRGSDSGHRESHRSSRRDSSRRRSSRSPADRRSHRRDYDRHRSERRDKEDVSDDDRRRRRHASDRESSYRRHRDRDSYDRKEKSSRRRRDYSRSRSPTRRSPDSDSRAPVRSKAPLPPQQDAYTSSEVVRTGESEGPPPEKEKPNFGQTGRLAAESKTVNVNGNSVVLKYHEPPEARKPPAKEPWRLYVFKGQDLLEMVELGIRSCWLIGKEQLVVDFPLEHPSCSKQHAALQFRFVEKRNEFGDRIGRVKPYLIDLESANGTTVNGDAIPAGRYVELRDKDVVKFGLSTREYVLMLPPPE
ncbi:putative FHA domain protein SNIP1 [Aspergillus neoniger CBS 115656]|uniref:SMAD/FHA domain-containing protein n=1 Tax=Aspergillus neoniger (strain CBS 115656) TaxID=1448310 RepID=A0A318YKE6_ASPNB|nr:SMAD/FHA domain-containing protein [Aspergillus neoniger CBS 115656]PYH34696.1 SMAD/FHA domain-containing protein [Aspergillus neoniger CBS 115656]